MKGPGGDSGLKKNKKNLTWKPIKPQGGEAQGQTVSKKKNVPPKSNRGQRKGRREKVEKTSCRGRTVEKGGVISKTCKKKAKKGLNKGG